MYMLRRVDTFRSGTVRLRELSANLVSTVRIPCKQFSILFIKKIYILMQKVWQCFLELATSRIPVRC